MTPSNLVLELRKSFKVILSLSKDALWSSNYTLRQAQCDTRNLSLPLLIIQLILFSTSAFCQIDNLKWQKADLTYEKPDNFIPRNYSFESDNAGEFITKSFSNAYWFFISDVDGDNCPFRPSCSVFFLESIKETNIFQASLMFFDRFTRDMNFVKGINHYPHVRSGYLYDPPQNYTLNQGRINYLPPAFIVDY